MKPERINFPCHEIMLEGVLHIPDGAGLFPAVVMCHPHPLYGGDMDNNVVMAVCDGLLEWSIACLRFNFRGTGGSGGVSGGGLKEKEDVIAAVDYLAGRKEINPQKLGLAGYSFGGGVALGAAQQDRRVKALALVSPALAAAAWEQIGQYPTPKLVLIGDLDTVVRFPRHALEGQDNFHIIAGADHSWWGFEGDIGRLMGKFFKKELG